MKTSSSGVELGQEGKVGQQLLHNYEWILIQFFCDVKIMREL